MLRMNCRVIGDKVSCINRGDSAKLDIAKPVRLVKRSSNYLDISYLNLSDLSNYFTMVRAVTARLNQSTSQITAKKHLKMHLRKIREREYSKLRALVPSVARKEKVTKVEVVEEAVRYIEELHQALLERFRRKTGDNEGITEDAMRSFVCQMMPLAFNQPPPPRKNYAKQQKRPSYLNVRRPKDF